MDAVLFSNCLVVLKIREKTKHNLKRLFINYVAQKGEGGGCQVEYNDVTQGREEVKNLPKFKDCP
jgi:hypothetical protein